MVRTSPSNAGGTGLIPDQGTKIPHALWSKNQIILQKQHRNRCNKDFKVVRIRKKSLKNRNCLDIETNIKGSESQLETGPLCSR